MANSDYTVQGQGSLCPTGTLQFAITPASATLVLQNFQEAGALEVGMAVLVGNEIMRVQAIALPNVSVLRGCADTVPASHPIGTRAWFFSDAATSDNRAYTATSTIGIKVMPFSLSSGPVPIAHAPPLPLTFNWRFARPYPPGKLFCNEVAWHIGPHALEETDTAFEFTWAHRDRILQADQLIGHSADSIGPEPGTTYTVVVRDADNTVVRTVAGITGDSWSYPRSQFEVDVPTGVGSLSLMSVRDGLNSWQGYLVLLQSASGEVPTGFGEAFGLDFGGGI